MNVVLRHTLSGSYYGNQKGWVNDPARAQDLGTIEHAVRLNSQTRAAGLMLLRLGGFPKGLA